jgi:hypothetical protein
MATSAEISAMISELNAMAAELNLLKCQHDEEQDYEFSLVGATGQGFEITSQVQALDLGSCLLLPCYIIGYG